METTHQFNMGNKLETETRHYYLFSHWSLFLYNIIYNQSRQRKNYIYSVRAYFLCHQGMNEIKLIKYFTESVLSVYYAQELIKPCWVYLAPFLNIFPKYFYMLQIRIAMFLSSRGEGIF